MYLIPHLFSLRLRAQERESIMAHEFETGFFVSTPAWHGLGVLLESAPETAQEAITCAGLDWEVSRRNLFAAPPSDGPMIPVEGNAAIVRESDNRILGIVGAQYDPIQNTKAFEFFDSFIQTGRVKYEAAGSLRNGQVIWILAKIEGELSIRSGDQVSKYLLLYNSHDGSVCLNVTLTPVRVVCMNTLQAARSQQNKDFTLKLKHTKSVNSRLDEAIEALRAYNEVYDSLAEDYRFLASKRVSPAFLAAFLDSLYPEPKERQGGRSRQIRELVTSLFQGRMIGGSEGSYWDLYNSVTEYAEHWSGAKNADTKLESVWRGTLAKKSTDALHLCLDFAQRDTGETGMVFVG